MNIQEGGAISNMQGKTVNEITLCKPENKNDAFQLWINYCLSYLTIEEVLQLKSEIQTALESYIKN